MLIYNYETEDGVLCHYGIPGMKWGHRKKYQTSSGKLNSLGKARKSYEDAKSNTKQVLKTERRNVGLGMGVNGIARSQKAAKNYNNALRKESSANARYITEKAKYNASKARNSQKAEFNTYRKAMSKTGLAGSAADAKSGGRSTALYNEIKVKKGKAYADRVSKKVQNKSYAMIAAGTAVAVGSAIVSGYLESRSY